MTTKNLTITMKETVNIDKDNNLYKTIIQLLKYGVIGLSNTLITLVVFYVMNTQFGISYGISNVGGYGRGVINSFVWNRT